jgi:phospholipase/carboxylesterase
VQAKVFEGEALRYILAKPDGFDADAGLPLVVLLHGFGASMYDLADLAPIIDADGYVYAFPNAPFTVEFGGGATGFSWMTGRPGMAPPAPDAPGSEQLLDAFMQEIRPETGAQDGRIVLGGFSQGGGLTLTYGLPRPSVFGALAVLSGFFRDAEAVRPRLPDKPSQPVFVAHGIHDPMINIEAGRGTRDFLTGLNYQVTYNEYEMAHEISSATMRDLIDWLTRVMPPGPKAAA